MLTDGGTATLPGGYWDAGGRLHRAVRMRPLTGREEELLAASTANPATLVTAVLSRCLLGLAAFDQVPVGVVRELLAGDRDWLLLQLRRLTFGDLVRADLICPWAECGEPVTVEFSLADLPEYEAVDCAPEHRLVLTGPAAEAGNEVAFRLPDGSDQEELAPWAARDQAAALTELLRRCVRRIGARPVPDADAVRALSGSARAQIEAEMERLAPHLERVVEIPCAECGRRFAAPFDLHRFFFGELRTDRNLLYREVHQLAYHYHWSEAEIMAMPRARRHTYLDLLDEEIERLNDAG
jgi:hypothetical protein